MTLSPVICRMLVCVLPLTLCTSVLSSTAHADVAKGSGTPWALKMFKDTNHDFGKVAKGAEVTFSFEFKNIYLETLHISNVRTSCSCASAKVRANTLESLETSAIDITIDTVRHERQKNPNLIITFDAPYRAEITLPMNVYIRTDVVLTPGSVNYGPVAHGEAATKIVDIAYAGRSNWTIREVRSKNEFLETNLKETYRANGQVKYQLQVVLKGTAPLGVLRDQITLITDDADGPTVPVLVEARVEADITVTPTPLSFGRLNPMQTKTVNVVLRGRKPFKIEKIECEHTEDIFKMRMPRTTQQVHLIPLTLEAPKEGGDIKEEFIITIEGREEPITIKAFAQVAAQ